MRKKFIRYSVVSIEKCCSNANIIEENIDLFFTFIHAFQYCFNKWFKILIPYYPAKSGMPVWRKGDHGPVYPGVYRHAGTSEGIELYSFKQILK